MVPLEPRGVLRYLLPFLLGVAWPPSGARKAQREGDPFHFTDNFFASSIVDQSTCFKRIPIPHFRIKEYSLPGAFFDEERCTKNARVKNEIRSSLLREDFEGNEFRLPKAINPVHYLIKLCPEVREPFTFTGIVEIELEVIDPTNKIVLNMVDLEIQSFSLKRYERRKENEIGSHFHKLSRSSSGKIGKARRKNSKFHDFKYYNLPKYKMKTDYKEFPPKQLYENKNPLPYKETHSKENEMRVTLLNVDEKLQTMTLLSEEPLSQNTSYKLKISFSGTTNSGLIGFYRIYHFDHLGRRRYSLVTQFQVSEARKTFPCFDEPGFRSSFTLILCREKSLRTLSNMPKIATVQKRDDPDRVWDLFRTSIPMATYLVAFAILDDYDYVNCNHSFIPFKVWAPHPHIQMADFACETGPKLLDFFENYFQLPYPLPKMDLIAVPQFFAFGMENWGLVTFIVDRLLIDFNAGNTLEMQQLALETISHEMSHQWFGNLVTPSWWSDIWLNEGFATFLSLLGFEYVRPSWFKIKEYIVKVLHSVLINDGVESSHPIVMNVDHPKDFFSLFDEISYGKGCFIVRMMMHMLTEKVFQKGLQRYLREMQFKSATQDDLWNYLTDVAHEEGSLWRNLTISQIMDTWILQKGYPVVSAFRLDDGNLAAAQHKFYLEMDEEKLSEELRRKQGLERPTWWIPLSITTKQSPNMSDTSPKFWMFTPTQVFHMETPIREKDWFLINMQQTGFFRVNYDTDNWLLIIRQLIEDHNEFDDVTRAQLIDDSFALAYSEELDYEIPLTMISYLKRETSPYVISTVLENIQPILEVYSHDALFGEIKEFLVTLLSSHYPKNGIRELPMETQFQKETAIKLIQTICIFYEPCIKEAKEIFFLWNENPSNFSIMEESLFDTLFCTAISDGGEKEWKMLWSIFSVNTHEELQQRLLQALSCSRHLWLNSRLLMVLAIEKSSLMDKFYLTLGLTHIAKNPISSGLAWEYLQYVWPNVVGTVSEQLYFEAVVPNLKTEIQLRDLISFVMSPTMDKTNMPKSYLQEMVRNVKRRVDFQVRNYDELLRWFASDRSHLYGHPQQNDYHSEEYSHYLLESHKI